MFDIINPIFGGQGLVGIDWVIGPVGLNADRCLVENRNGSCI